MNRNFKSYKPNYNKTNYIKHKSGLDDTISILRAIGLVCGGLSTLLDVYNKYEKNNNNKKTASGKYLPLEEKRKKW